MKEGWHFAIQRPANQLVHAVIAIHIKNGKYYTLERVELKEVEMSGEYDVVEPFLCIPEVHKEGREFFHAFYQALKEYHEKSGYTTADLQTVLDKIEEVKEDWRPSIKSFSLQPHGKPSKEDHHA